MDYKDGLHNPFVRCPYNKAHEVPKLRLQRHLLKCKKQYAGQDMKTCPFNATHIIPAKSLQNHISTCVDQNVIEGQKLNTATHGEPGPSFHPDVPMEEWSQDEDDEDPHGGALPG